MQRFYNTLTRRIEDFRPIDPQGPVTMYSCGPTVYRSVHIGNLRSFLLADLVRRVLAYQGHLVNAVMNITDVGHMTDELTGEGRDRMEIAVEDEDLNPDEIAEKYTEAFLADCDALNIRRFDAYPRATEHIALMIELTVRLIERGHAYEHDGTVYFDVTTFPAYGRLSNQSLEAMRAGHRVEIDTIKRNHQDFTLWRSAGQTRLMKWDSPWGRGFPGWHIECSAMSLELLGDRFDIHTGGVDNVFPHHEDEIAQSEGALGHRVVGTWIHGEHLLLGDAKMAKSAGNAATVAAIVEHGYDPLAFRYLCFTGRYRRQMHFSPDALDAAATALRRTREHVSVLATVGQIATTASALREVLDDRTALAAHDRFLAAIADDLDLPTALTVVHDTIGDDSIPAHVRWTLVASWDEVLGLDLVGAGELSPELSTLVRERDDARRAKDFVRADELRDRLRAAGVELLDSPGGTRWVRR